MSSFSNLHFLQFKLKNWETTRHFNNKLFWARAFFIFWMISVVNFIMYIILKCDSL
jgi:hypothetical protein